MSLQANIQQISGREVEITVRSMTGFTFSFDGQDDEAAARIVKFFENEAREVSSEFDEECDMTCVYIDIH